MIYLITGKVIAIQTIRRIVLPLEPIRSFIAFDIEERNVLRNLSRVQNILVEIRETYRKHVPSLCLASTFGA